MSSSENTLSLTPDCTGGVRSSGDVSGDVSGDELPDLVGAGTMARVSLGGAAPLAEGDDPGTACLGGPAPAYSLCPAPVFVLCPAPEARDLYEADGSAGGSRGDSGTDLRFPAAVTVPPCAELGGVAFPVGLGVRARCYDAGHRNADGTRGKAYPYLLIPRSSIGKTPLSLANSEGLIDAGYTGELRVALRNHSARAYVVERGTALFQLVRPDLAPGPVALADGQDPLFAAGATARGAGGYGSTGAEGRRK